MITIYQRLAVLFIVLTMAIPIILVYKTTVVGEVAIAGFDLLLINTYVPASLLSQVLCVFLLATNIQPLKQRVLVVSLSFICALATVFASLVW